jgi:hypothetical protein
MIPITKNIRVVDEFGKEYEATYLKRAEGLVKKGRAHFIDSNTISLVCPPENLEDKNLETNKNKIDQDYIIKKIDQIMNEKDYLLKALDSLTHMPKSDGPGDLGAQAKAQAIAEVVKSREETNQQMIKLFNTLLFSVDSKE